MLLSSSTISNASKKKKSKNKKSSRSKEYGVDLPTEVLYEIFYRLPTIDPVYRFRCVSKLWNSLLSDPSFINKIFNKITTIPWIFMYEPSDLQVQLYLNQYHQFINHHDGLSFEFLLETDPFKTQKIEKACLLDSCSNGLVLYSADPELHRPSASSNTMFYICNPLTKQWVSLPPRPTYNGSRKFYGQQIKLVCESWTASLSHSICNYKVVNIYSVSERNTRLQIFSSDTGRWKTSKVPSPEQVWYDFSKLVIRHGVLYWTNKGINTDKNMLIAYSLENKKNGSDRCRSIGFPRMSTDAATYSIKVASFTGESEGSILYGYICAKIDQNDHQANFKVFLDMWQLEDDYTSGGLNWQMLHNSIELKRYRSSCVTKAIYMCINPVDRNVIIIVDQGCCLAYNITDQTYEVLLGCPIPTRIKDHQSPPILITPKPTVIPEITPY